MKILLVMDPGILVPPKGYGGIERIIEMLAKQYVREGHVVDLLVTKGSAVDGCKIYGYGKDQFPPNKINSLLAIPYVWFFLFKNRKKYDFIHNFGRLLFLFPVLNSHVKKIMSYQREITTSNISNILKFPCKNIFFTGCSKNLVDRASPPGFWKAIYNCCEFNKYRLVENFSDSFPLIFLGRIERIKGCHTAISIAKATSSNLIIAGNISPLKQEQEYFKNEIEPYIDGKQIKYLGTLDDNEKNEWLGKSKALLMPIEWEEPFGIVMIEAMSCGTPVIAYKRGSTSEVINHGINGFLVENEEEMIIYVNKLNIIDRKKCRDFAFNKFDISIIAKQYLELVK